MDNIIKKNLTSDHVVEKAEITEVLQQYRHAKLKENETPFQFWKNYNCSTNIVEWSLAEIAKHYLTPPPTSVDVERLFSSAANKEKGWKTSLLSSKLAKG